MAGFRGPGRSFGVPALDVFELEQRQQNTNRDDAFQREQAAYGRARDFGASMVADRNYQDHVDAERQQLLMTPGVIRGGSTATRPQSDSPLNVGASTAFDRFGEQYSYDPYAAAEQAGTTRGLAENAESKTRYDSLRNIPGIGERMASRLVYGRGTVPGDGEPTPLSEALATYVDRPGRDTAAEAVRHGASLNSFDAFLPARGLTAGTDAAFDWFKREDDYRTQNDMKARRASIDEAAAARPDPKKRTQKITEKGTGRVGLLDMDTGEVDWTNAVTNPGGKPESMVDKLLRERAEKAGGGTPAAPAAGAPAVPAAAPSKVPSGAADPSGTPLDDGFQQQLEEAYTALRQRGVVNPSPAALRAEIARRKGAGARPRP